MVVDPVVAGFHPDPSVCRVGADYFLACSSFEYFPGLPVFHSTDLVRWTQIGNALDRPSQLRLATAPSSGGVYAPTLRHHDGRFWLITTNLSDRGHLIVTAEDPAGPWSEPVFVDGVGGIDPDLAWDEAGTCWLTCAVFGDGGGRGQIAQAPIDPYTGGVLDPPRRLWSGTGLAAPEAPHLYQVDGAWYLIIAEGGTERGHAVSVARGPRATGPFHGRPGNPVLSHRSTTSPVQNTGHGDLVQAVDGTWWMVLLGVRPRGGTPGWHVLGRETFLTPVHWIDGWPVPQPVTSGTGPGGAVPAGVSGPAERDDFDARRLDPGWLSIRERPAGAYSLGARPGWLTLHGSGQTLDDHLPVFVGRRQRHHTCRIRARVDASAGAGGLTIRLDERHHYDVEVADGEIRCLARIGPLRQRLGSAPAPDAPVVLGIDIDPDPAGGPTAAPDVVRLGFEAADGFVSLGELDGRYLSTEVTGGFTGRLAGLYAVRGAVAFDWYEYRPGS